MRLSRKRKKQVARSVRRWMPGFQCSKYVWLALWKMMAEARQPMRFLFQGLDFGREERTAEALWYYGQAAVQTSPRAYLLSLVSY